jgi:hypothetical protein
MYRVTVEMPNGDISVTTHGTAMAAFSRIVEVRQAGGRATVTDGNSNQLADNQLIALMAKEMGD